MRTDNDGNIKYKYTPVDKYARKTKQAGRGGRLGTAVSAVFIRGSARTELMRGAKSPLPSHSSTQESQQNTELKASWGYVARPGFRGREGQTKEKKEGGGAEGSGKRGEKRKEKNR